MASPSNIQSVSRSATPIPPTKPGDSRRTSAYPTSYYSNLTTNRRLAASRSNISSLSMSALPIPPTQPGDFRGTSAFPRRYNSSLTSNRRLVASLSNNQSPSQSTMPFMIIHEHATYILAPCASQLVNTSYCYSRHFIPPFLQK